MTKYSYDLNYQLTRAEYPGVAPFNGEVDSWTYDAIGNRLTNTVNGNTANYAYFKNGANPNNGQKLQSDGVNSYTYDNNGNTLTAGSYSYTWGSLDGLIGISGGGPAVDYNNDWMKRRADKTISGVKTNYLYDGNTLVEEKTGTATTYYLNGPGIDEPLAMSRSGSVYYYDVDGLGSVAAVNDANGTVQDSYVYDAWGNIKSQTVNVPQPFVYTAREMGEGGLFYYRARYYNPQIGRFVSEDPVRFASSTNFYAYTASKPVTSGDPLGLVTPLTPGEEAKCLVDIRVALTMVVKSSTRNCCRGFFARYGCNYDQLLDVSDNNLKLGSIKECKEIPCPTGVGLCPVGGYVHRPTRYDDSIYICPYACRMGIWTIANAIIHELMHKCRMPAGDFAENIPDAATNNCMSLTLEMESIEITVSAQ